MNRSIFVILAGMLAALLMAGMLGVSRSVSAGQGKGGEVVAKPTPVPAKTPIRKTSTPRKSMPKPRAPACSAYSPTKGTGVKHTAKLSDDVTMELVEIPAGSFCMGSTTGADNERPVHEVTIKYSFFMGRYEVTQAQWLALMKTNPSTTRGDNLPVDRVSWDNAQAFIQKLNEMNDGYVYRLPTEAEREYAARAGTTSTYFWGENVKEACRYENVSDAAVKDRVGWSVAHCRDGYYGHSPVGRFRPNAFGLYDMIGNVREWCEDQYHDSYNGAPTDGTAWLNAGKLKAGELETRVARGGSANDTANLLRSSARHGVPLGLIVDGYGFRVVAYPRSQ